MARLFTRAGCRYEGEEKRVIAPTHNVIKKGADLLQINTLFCFNRLK